MKRGEAGKRKKTLATLIERKEDKKIKINVRFWKAGVKGRENVSEIRRYSKN